MLQTVNNCVTYWNNIAEKSYLNLSDTSMESINFFSHFVCAPFQSQV